MSTSRRRARSHSPTRIQSPFSGGRRGSIGADPITGSGRRLPKEEEGRIIEERSREVANELRSRFSTGGRSSRGAVGGGRDEMFRPAVHDDRRRFSHQQQQQQHSSRRINSPYNYSSDDDHDDDHNSSSFDHDGFRRPQRLLSSIRNDNSSFSGRVTSSTTAASSRYCCPRRGGNSGRIFTGLLSAPITPFNPRTGKADPDVIRNEYAELHRADGVDGVFCCGTTGESMSLSTAERMQACAAWVETGLQVCCHISSQSLLETQKLARHAQDVGADAIAVMCPAFFKPGKVENYVEFLEEVYRAAPEIPMLVYHFPMLTGINFRLYEILTAAMGRIPTLRGAKFTSQDLSDFVACQSIGGQITDMIYSIEGNMFAAAFCQTKAFVGMQFSMIAPVFRRVWEAAARGDVERTRAENGRAAEFQLAMQESCTGFSLEKAVALTKYVVGLRLGRDCGEPRAPGARLTSEEKIKIERTVLPFCGQQQQRHRGSSIGNRSLSSRRRNKNNNFVDESSDDYGVRSTTTSGGSKNKFRLIL